MNESYNYSKERRKVEQRIIIYLQLLGFFSAQFKNSSIAEQSSEIATNILYETDNPMYYLMLVYNMDNPTLKDIRDMVDNIKLE